MTQHITWCKTGLGYICFRKKGKFKIPIGNVPCGLDNPPLTFQDEPYEESGYRSSSSQYQDYSYNAYSHPDSYMYRSAEINQNTPDVYNRIELSQTYPDNYPSENKRESQNDLYASIDYTDTGIESVNAEQDSHDEDNITDTRQRRSVRPRAPSRKIREQQETQEPKTSSNLGPSTSGTEVRQQRRSRTDYSTWSQEDRDNQERTYDNEYSKGYRERRKEKNMNLEKKIKELEKKNTNLKKEENKIKETIERIKQIMKNMNIKK